MVAQRSAFLFWPSSSWTLSLALVAGVILSVLNPNRQICSFNANSIALFANAFPTKQRIAWTSSPASSSTVYPVEQKCIKGTGRIRCLSASIPFFLDVENDWKKTEKKKNDAPAFLIEPISRLPPISSGDAVYKTISDLCIDVFFKELLDPSGNGNVNFVKEWQITYLKNLQAADLERRRDRYPDTNEMFLAYEIKKSTNMEDALKQPLLMEEELRDVYNMEGQVGKTYKAEGRNFRANAAMEQLAKDDSTEDCFVRGDLLGFVEITQRPYGLGSSTQEELSSSSTNPLESTSPFYDRPLRPVLTNLAVLKTARKYGIGSKLLEACEQHVRKGWNMNEIVLEVEDYNTNGLQFYRDRGYEVLFSDPASRRYDIQGFWLNKVRCRREIMRKVLTDNRPTSLIESADSLIRKIRESVSNF